VRALSNTVVMVTALALVAFSISLEHPPAASAGAPASAEASDAIRLFAELGAAKGTVDARSLDSLGPSPFLSFAPDRDPTEIILWRALSQMIALRGAEDRQRPDTTVYLEREPAGTVGGNDTVATGEFVAGVGPGRGGHQGFASDGAEAAGGRDLRRRRWLHRPRQRRRRCT